MESIPSLFVVGLPRSLSTLTFHVARLLLNLKEPIWTTDGEILNVDRFILTPPEFDHAGSKYTLLDQDPHRFAQHLQFLEHCVIDTGFVYKDVVHPYVVAEFLRRRSYPVLFVDRPVVDVAYTMLKREWTYPAIHLSGVDVAEALILGLISARTELLTVATAVTSFDELIVDENAIGQALKILYPKKSIGNVEYIRPEFQNRSTLLLSERHSTDYRRLVDIYIRVSND